MQASFSTERMAVEHWNDTLSAFELQELSTILNEDVTAFLPDSLQYKEGETEVSEWAKEFSSGGNKVSSVRVNGELAGLLILMSPLGDACAAMHLGYIFCKTFWGRGLATELIRGLFQQLKVDGYNGAVHAGVAKGNPASVKVLQKVGFEAMDKSESDDVDWFCYTFAASS